MSEARTAEVELMGVQTASNAVRPQGRRTFFIAAVVAQVSALLRYVVLARFLGPEQLGLASTLVVTAAFFDLISDTGSDRYLIQNRDGDKPAVQRLVHLVFAGRGALTAAGLMLVAWPVAMFYKEPRLVHGFVFLALSPLILGLTHLDVRRRQRHFDFRAESKMIICAECGSLIVTAAAAYLTRDFTAILYGLIARALLRVLVSHISAERPYRFGFEKSHARQLARFSIPLMMNGVLLFLGTQGDRVIVGSRLGVKELGYYSAILLLIYYPSGLLTSYLHAIYLSSIAAQRDDPVKRRKVSDQLAGQTTLMAVAMVAGFALVTPIAVPILYGHRFVQTEQTIALIGILQTCRFMIVWPTTVALSNGNSGQVLAISIVRLLAYPGAIIGALLIGGLQGVVTGFILGEAASLLSAILIINRKASTPIWHGFDRLLLYGLACVFVVYAGPALGSGSPLIIGSSAIGGFVLLGSIIAREREILFDACLALSKKVRRFKVNGAMKISA
jgi:O-antigen/teichoic acid export membrane protein